MKLPRRSPLELGPRAQGRRRWLLLLPPAEERRGVQPPDLVGGGGEEQLFFAEGPESGQELQALRVRFPPGVLVLEAACSGWGNQSIKEKKFNQTFNTFFFY